MEATVMKSNAGSALYFALLFLVCAAAILAGIAGGWWLGGALGGGVLPFLLAVCGAFALPSTLIWASVQNLGRFQRGHAAISFLLAFTTIITANMLLATNAVRTFPGLETDNSYVASQTFDDRRASQEALRWDVGARYSGGLVLLNINDSNGTAVQVLKLEAVLGRPTHVKDDREPQFRFDGSGYSARETLAPGNWNIRMKATARDGTVFEQRIPFTVAN